MIVLGIAVCALGLAFAAAVLPFLPVFLPQIGPRLFYRLPARQRLLGGLGLLLAVAAIVLQFGTVTALILAGTLLLAVQAILYPGRVLVALDNPPTFQPTGSLSVTTLRCSV